MYAVLTQVIGFIGTGLAVFTWAGPITLLAGIGPAATALVSWSRNGKRIRLVSVLVNFPCLLADLRLFHRLHLRCGV